MKSRHVVTALLLLLTFAAGYSFSQNQLPGTQKTEKDDYATKLSEANLVMVREGALGKDAKGNYINGYIGGLYVKMGLNSADAEDTANHIYSGFLIDTYTAKGAAQISQVADEQRLKLDLIQIGQNQKIISLLEKIANKGNYILD